MSEHRSALLAAFLVSTLLTICHPVEVLGADVPVGSPVYRVLDRLWAEGKASGYWPDRLPVTEGQAREALAEAAPEWGGFLAEGVFDAQLAVGTGWSREGAVGDNRAGLESMRGVGGGVQVRVSGTVSAYLDARVPSPEDGAAHVAEAYVVLDAGSFRVTLGRENLWWGPGRRGDLLLTDNAVAPDAIRIENGDGFVLPGFLSAAGEWRLSLFLGRLAGGRPAGAVEDPVFGGTKISVSPHPNLVLSVTRTFLFGGEGRDEDLGALLDALFAREGDEWQGNVVGNQIAGLSAVWRIPSDTLPVVLYAEAAGEDEANRQPSQWGFLAGAYLPRLGGLRRTDLRVEAASTDMPGHDSVWYEHPDYPYVSDGRVMGHPAGNDARDLTVEVGLFPSVGGWFGFSATRTLRGVSGSEEGARTAFGVRGAWSRGPAVYEVEWRSERGDDVPGAGQDGSLWSATVEVRL